MLLLGFRPLYSKFRTNSVQSIVLIQKLKQQRSPPVATTTTTTCSMHCAVEFAGPFYIATLSHVRSA